MRSMAAASAGGSLLLLLLLLSAHPHPSSCLLLNGPPRRHDATRLAASSSAGGEDGLGGLTSALARIDEQRRRSMLQRSAGGAGAPRSRWSKLALPPREGRDEGEGPIAGEEEEYVWLLEPPNSTPSCVVAFVGGAGLGQFPHVAYDEMLTRVSDRTGAAVVAAPYSVGLDHFALSRTTGDALRRALIALEDDPARSYPAGLPTFGLSHSLGCKLQTIYLAATGQEFDGVGFLAFNNFSFGETVRMARNFADQIGESSAGMTGGGGGGDAFGGMGSAFQNGELLDGIFSFAETFIQGVGIDFEPDARATERLVSMKYGEGLRDRTRMFVFDGDALDSSREFLDACESSSPSEGGGDATSAGPTCSGVPGGHLAPVFIRFATDDLEAELRDGAGVPPEAFEAAREAAGGFRGASFGDEQALDELVSEVCGWMLGKPPARGPEWESDARNEPAARLLGYSDDDG